MKAVVAPPKPYRFTRAEYQRMGEAGIFTPDERVELIEGEILRMSPIGKPHAWRVTRLTNRFARRLGERVLVAVQNPVAMGADSEPQPDLVLVRPEADDEDHPGPEDILLLIEIADSTLRLDRQRKVPLYGRLGVPETWLIALREDCVYAYRDPAEDGYRTVQTYRRGESLAPQAFPQETFAVDDLLGSR